MGNFYVIKGDPTSSPKEVEVQIDPTVAGISGDITYTAKGKVTDYRGNPVVGVTVKVYHYRPILDPVLLGSAFSSATGEYIVYYNTSNLSVSISGLVLTVKVFDDDTETNEYILSQIPLITTPPAIATIDLVVGSIPDEEPPVFVGQSEFSRISTLIDQEIVTLSSSDLEGLLESDIYIFAEQINEDPAFVDKYIQSLILVNEQPAISAEVYYGLLRYDLPTNLSELIRIPDSLKTQGLEWSISLNIIDPDIADQIDAINDTFLGLLSLDALTDIDGDSYLAKLLTLAGVSDTLSGNPAASDQTRFFSAYLQYGEEDNFWDLIVTQLSGQPDAILTTTQRDNLRLLLQIGVITQQHVPLISYLYSTLNIADANELGSFAPTDWLSYVEASGGTVPGVQDDPVLVEDKDLYVEALMSATETAFPTEVLIKYMSGDADYNGSDIHNWLVANPDFDIDSSSPRNYIAVLSPAPAPALVSTLYEIKRLWHLGSGYDKLTTIKNLQSANVGLTSSAEITAVGKRNFVKAYALYLGGEQEADRIYKVAVKRTAAAEVLQSSYNPAVNTLSTNVYNDLSVAEGNTTDFPSLEVLFGSQDYCTCTLCRSSFSPSAYLMDLLTFLKQTQIQNSTDTAWEVLQTKRPEFKYLELSCDNTNVTLPYIDIVNEVLEHAVDPPTFVDPQNPTELELTSLKRQTTLEENVLKVIPEHTRESAYEVLKSSVYPWLLPFHKPNQEAKLYLDQLSINKGNMVRAIAGNAGFGTAIDIDEALAYLNISAELQSVLLGDTFVSSFGNANASTLENIPELLQRSGLEYAELLELMKTSFINPVPLAITFSPVSSCALANATLTDASDPADSDHFSDFFKDLHRFERLRRVLDWTVEDLDLALSALGHANITATALIDLTAVKKLVHRFRLGVGDILSWYGVLSDKSFQDKASQYDQIFLNPIYNTDSSVRDSFSTGTVNLSSEEHLSVITSALRLSIDDVQQLANDMSLSGTVTKGELTYLYGASVLMRALSLSVEEYLDVKTLIAGLVPIDAPGASSSPNKTLEFLVLYDQAVESGFSVKDLNYLLRNQFDNTYKKSTEEELAITLENVRTVIQERILDKNVSLDKSKDDLLHFFLIFMNEEIAVSSVEVVENGTVEGAESLIEEHWIDFVVNIDDTKASLVTAGGTLLTLESRVEYVYELFHTALLTELELETLVVQTLSDDLGYSQSLIDELLRRDKSDDSDSDQVIALFTSASFVYSNDSINNASPYQALFQYLLATQKIAMVADRIGIDSSLIGFVLSSTDDTEWFDLRGLADTTSTIDSSAFEKFVALLQAFDLEQTYANVSTGFSIVGLIQQAVQETSTATVQASLAEGMDWQISDLTYFCEDTGFDFQTEDYQNEKWLIKLEGVFTYINRLSTSAEKLSGWAKSGNLTTAQADNIRSSVRAQYSDDTWFKVGGEIRDKLRIMQRDALAARLIGDKVNYSFDDVDDLYEYFLLDTQMSPCMMTSRVKLAISTVQLWVQRIRMDLEPTIQFDDEQIDEWNWRKNYRVWEAARKVFLYPENWLEPELREDKSPFFQDMEDELLQDEVTAETAEQAYLNYLTKLDDVANLEISGIYREEDRNILHVFARTKDDPHIYYYRRQEDGFRWTAWERVDLDIQGNHLIPITFNRRPMVFWPIFGNISKEVTDTELASGNPKNPTTYIEVKMAYSEYKNNTWQPKKMATSSLISLFSGTSQNYFFKVSIDASGLRVDAFYSTREASSYIGGFVLNNCNGQLQSITEQGSASPSDFSVSSSSRRNMKIIEDADSSQFAITEKLSKVDIVEPTLTVNIPTEQNVILRATPDMFKITYPVTGVDLLSEVPFFYEDNSRVFFVLPSDETYQKDVIGTIPVSLTKIERETVVEANPPEQDTDFPPPDTDTDTGSSGTIVEVGDVDTEGNGAVSQV